MDPDPKEIVQRLFSTDDPDERLIDELVADDLVNHAAGPQGREGWKQILAMIRHDLGVDTRVEHHRFLAEGEMVTHHMTFHGRHVGSSMPLLRNTEPTGKPVSWTFIHLWRVVDGRIVEHWACRDDVGLLSQVGAWP